MSAPLLEICDLNIAFNGRPHPVHALRQFNLRIQPGESVGLVGESGSGKSVTALSIMRLLSKNDLHHENGIIRYSLPDGSPITLNDLSESALTRVRGKEIAMIFQEPMSSLNPVMRCGHQITEAIRHHLKSSRTEAREQALHLLEQVRLPDPARAYRAYPHELSGGQKQRVMIAMALSCEPRLLLADEPTTALDVTVQKGILDLLQEIREARQLALLFISHDLGVVRHITDRVSVLYRGELQEEGDTAGILRHPKAPYTRGLVACRPRIDVRYQRMPTLEVVLPDPEYQPLIIDPEASEIRRSGIYAQKPLLEVSGIHVRYPRKRNWFGAPVEWTDAVQNVSFELYPGECLGLAGESGCGKTTLGKAIARLTEVHQGQVLFRGENWLDMPERALRRARRHLQVIFQDPYAALNPRMPVGEAISEPMRVHGLVSGASARRERVVELLEQVGLQADHYHRMPHAFSGGQRQRICIARALALEPRLLICDEIVSALDVSVQATILNLLADLQGRLGLSFLFISHDLSVLHQVCDRLLVMKDGRLDAEGRPEVLFQSPPTPYVRSLLEAVL
ncbi:MAG: ABC transporter ATP-binding protein [Saprospiraceae bacterium]|nr:ABC transporter ATP-binding protein [Saprospiraceae bacterium]